LVTVQLRRDLEQRVHDVRPGARRHPEPLAQRNVDTGMGLERLALFLGGHESVWQTDELHELTVSVSEALGVAADRLQGDAVTSLRIVTTTSGPGWPSPRPASDRPPRGRATCSGS
jgi:alanyl-tRNA synthetase